MFPNPSSPPSEPSAASASAQAAPRRADARFLFAHPAHLVALGFGSGLSPKAPGTAGTLWAWAAFVVWRLWVPPAQFDVATAWLLAVSALVGWWACTVAARNLRIADPGCIVWDEVLAFWLMLWLIEPAGFVGQLVAFALFRYFDAAKPGPVAWADRVFKGTGWRGGFGILFDDLVAAFCALLVIAVWRWLWM